jgi:hypothetical protein
VKEVEGGDMMARKSARMRVRKLLMDLSSTVNGIEDVKCRAAVDTIRLAFLELLDEE